MYLRDCEKAEIIIRVGHDDLQEILGTLEYDKRKGGLKGRCLISDLPRFGLKRGDRLEPAAPYWDIGAVDSWSSFPLRMVFGEFLHKVW